MNRPDAPLIRHLSKFQSPALGEEYHRLPLFLIPQDATFLADQEQEIVSTVEDILYLPYPDLLLEFPSGTWRYSDRVFREIGVGGLPDRGTTWMRIRSVKRALEQPGAKPLIAAAHLQALAVHFPLDECVFAETWEEKTERPDGSRSFPDLPDFSVFPLRRNVLLNFDSYWHAYPNSQHLEGRAFGLWCNFAKCTLTAPDIRQLPCSFSEILMSAHCRFAILALAYITAGISLTVHVRPEQAEKLKPHVARDKPWLQSRAHYILIDPERLRDYGHPSGEEHGTHHSPIPHQRRGHWRRLPEGYRKERTWVRPSFVGAGEWKADGQHYKIVG